MKYKKNSVQAVVRAILFVCICCVSVCQTVAAPITGDQVRRAVTKWIKDRPAAHMGETFDSGVSGVRSVEGTAGTNLFYIADLEEGGFVVTSADDEIAPVIAFSDKGALQEDVRNPLWAMLKIDMAQRMKLHSESSTNATLLMASTGGVRPRDEWADLLSDDDSTNSPTLAVAGRSSLSDVRVAALLTSKWGQTTAYNDKCYNKYTPNYYPCGCIATAGAQLMYFHEVVAKPSVAERLNGRAA